MSQNQAWGLVAGQFALIIALVVIPPGTLWTRGLVAWIVAGVFVSAGAVIGVWAGIRLGTNLTPNPIPREGGRLETGGLYRLVRHPIYTAVLSVGVGLTTLGASIWHLVIFFSLVMLLGIKARAEERLLREKYPEYREYQARVGRFLPGVGRIPPSL